MSTETNNLGRMHLNELINHLAAAKAAMRDPGVVALRLCECCIDVTMAPGELVARSVDLFDPVEGKKIATLGVK